MYDNAEDATPIANYLPVPWLDHAATTRGQWGTLPLAAVRDRLAAQVAQQQPEDQEYTLGHYHLRTGADGSRTTVQRLSRQGLTGPAMPLTRNGLQQLAREVLPSRGLAYVDQLAALGDNGRKLADLNWSMFMRAADKPRMVRTAVYNDRGTPTRAIRSVVSQGYARVDDLDLLDLLLDLPDAAELPVLAYDRTDTMLRVRLALDPLQGRPSLDNPIAIVDLTNSEVGRRSVTMRAGIWRLVCTNGMTAIDPGAVWRWNHSGDPRRIMGGVPAALEDMRTRVSPTLAAYDAARDTAIDDAIAWMEASLTDHLTGAQLAAAGTALLDDTTTPGMGLASVVDAISLAAQDQDSLEARESMELAATAALRIGLRDARHGQLQAPVAS